jgi:hypothetical protein
MPMKLRHTLALALLAASLLTAGASSLFGQAAEPGRSTIGGSGPIKDELNTPTNAAVEKGLKWLAANSTASGNNSEQIAIASLAGLAFLAHGDMPGDGPYGKEAEAILNYVLKNCQESGLVAGPSDGSPMYGHGFAALYLAEVYGMTTRKDVGEKLHNAIRLIVNTQNPQGGWRYQPAPNDADISVTICQVMALRAARNSGIKVPNKTIDMAIQYVKGSQQSDGGFAYVLGSGGSGPARSAAGVACLYYTRSGDAFADEIKRGIAYVKRTMIAGNQNDGHFFYGHYYATQACFMYGGDAWEAYWPAIRQNLLAKQQANGNWTGENSATYCTAMALIILQVPNRYLPILQK